MSNLVTTLVSGFLGAMFVLMERRHRSSGHLFVPQKILQRVAKKYGVDGAALGRARGKRPAGEERSDVDGLVETGSKLLREIGELFGD